jgi:nicotinate-nucleotide pyrophosphorylase (carboxylating)
MSQGFSLERFDLDAFVAATLAEDLGELGDITSAAVIPADARFTGVMDSRDAITVAGLPIAEAFFRALDPEVAIERLVEDGAQVVPGTDLMRIEGKARALLTAERPALNTVQHLSGIATMTRAYVDRIAGTGATLLDTRKTIPGMRVLEKYATRMGGATNHRMGLWDGAMIKDNHVAVAGSVEAAAARAAAAGIATIIVEVDRVDQIEPALAAGATHLLLDNMDPATLRGAVTLVGGRVPTEASGGVRLDTIRMIAETGVTYVSAGRLTQSAPAADIGLDFEPIR